MTLREDKERVKTSREELGKFFYDLAKASFIGLVVGGVVSLMTKQIDEISFCWLLMIGILSTIFLAVAANNILNNK